MGIWCFIILSVIIGAVANEGTHPNNQTVALKEVTTAPKPQIPKRVELLSHTLSDKIKVFNDRVNEMNSDMGSILLALSKSKGSYMDELMQHESLSCKYISSCITKSLTEMNKETNEMFHITHKLLEKFEDKLQRFSTSTTQRMVNLEQKLDRLPEMERVYFMRPDPSKDITFAVSRDWTNNHGFGGNWTVFQRRINGLVSFSRNWSGYKQGFGDLRGEHWLGLDKLHAIVKTRQHELLIVLEDFFGVIAYAHYDDFQIGNESEKYIIKSVGKYTGTAGDSFTHHKDELFTTYDQDNDNSNANCAEKFGGGWWFYDCYQSHLNGIYVNGKHILQDGIEWRTFRGLSSLKSTKMMVRPAE
ncbi:angiopoietin-related protein 2-like [Anopheles marshallii]|uniref:angiopoietin-related protein 2-like n=1 Tax=Anopheles marshallii TaxID=1521116 RepID=UPI00237AC2B7|nr:angiopoietin-related protein 2-like [Anopheles marshallii]